MRATPEQHAALILLGWEGPDTEGDYRMRLPDTRLDAWLLRPCEDTPSVFLEQERRWGRWVLFDSLANRDSSTADPVQLAIMYQTRKTHGSAD